MCCFFAFAKRVKTDREKGSGIVFFQTTQLNMIKEFYIDRLGCELWIDQGSCAILRHGNLPVGFCKGKRAESKAVVTFFYEKREDVDLRSIGISRSVGKKIHSG